jgi:hypothetical protein
VRRHAAAVAVVLAAATAGCGDQGAEPPATSAVPTTTVRATQSGWAAKADAVCVGYQARIDALPPPTTQAEAVTLLRKTVLLAGDELRALEDLAPAPAERELVAGFLRRLRLVVAATDRLAKAAAAADEAGQTAALSEGESAAAEAQTLADALGLTACGAPTG